ncbi:MAG: ABC transporter substrate-binding protein [Actinobacteria bacterium]|nr:ABC transporter substrate-binding protein [Actinomycetota bacterium]
MIAVVLVVLSWPNRLQENPVEGLRIISLSPAITEILFELGLGEQIVGVSEYSDYPLEAEQIPRVGGYGEPNIELILRSRPGLVITQQISPEKIRQLQNKIGPVCPVLVLKLDTLTEIVESVQEIAKATNTSKRGHELADRWNKKIERLQKRYGNLSEKERVRVYVEIGSNPLRTCGQGSYLSEIISLAGGKNMGDAATGSLWPVIASETVVVWNPEVILLSGMKRSGDFKQEISSRLSWEDIEAVKTGRIIELGDAYKRQGPRLFEELEKLADMIQSKTNESKKSKKGKSP